MRDVAELRKEFDACVTGALDNAKIGGSPEMGQVYATTALAIATYFNEPVDRIEVDVTGALAVDR